MARLLAAILIFPVFVFAQGSGGGGGGGTGGGGGGGGGSTPSSGSSPSGGSADSSGGSPRTSSNGIVSDESNFVVTRLISGELTEIGDGTFTLRTRKGKDVKVFFNHLTRVKIAGKTIKLSEIEDGQIIVGQSIRITYVPIDDFRAPSDKLAFEIKVLSRL